MIQCNGDENDKNNIPKKVIPVKILSPSNETQYNIGDLVALDIQVNDPSKISDMSLFIDDTLFMSISDIKSQTVHIPTENGRVGFVNLYLAYTDVDGKPHRDNRSLVFFSNEVPNQLFANIVNTYPHNKSSYTQGLEFYNGHLYESTGQVGESLITEVDLTTGIHHRFKNLDAPHFGEGITILNDTIYQLTWQSNICFLYDMEFNKIGEFNYDGEGWGLCNNGTSIIMTNGNSELIWRNPRTFEVEKKIYAFDHQNSIVNLNEVELINGKLYVNVYTENKIIEVDTTTGKVISNIDCNSLALEGEVNGANVLNGIAYDEITGKTYMTGKLWPKLFEVKFED
tara:strand:- start:293 stop:1315 length:1023 start_codon:yes stop_codon:yes gene_type:complete